jgi:hypothetical protein
MVIVKRASLPFTAASMTVWVDDEQKCVIVVLVVIFARVRGGVETRSPRYSKMRTFRDISDGEHATVLQFALTRGEVGMGGPPRLGCDWSNAFTFFSYGSYRRAPMAGWC